MHCTVIRADVFHLISEIICQSTFYIQKWHLHIDSSQSSCKSHSSEHIQIICTISPTPNRSIHSNLKFESRTLRHLSCVTHLTVLFNFEFYLLINKVHSLYLWFVRFIRNVREIPKSLMRVNYATGEIFCHNNLSRSVRSCVSGWRVTRLPVEQTNELYRLCTINHSFIDNRSDNGIVDQRCEPCLYDKIWENEKL